MSAGAELIAVERQRQIEQEGWTADHDDEHAHSEMSRAAVAYVNASVVYLSGYPPLVLPPISWPREWHPSWWKPSDDPIRNLVKAGALIAAEIDRLQRASESES